MSLAILRAAIKTAIESVANVGVVTAYEPHVQTEAELKAFFQVADNAQLLGWTVTRERTEERDDTTDKDMDQHLIVVRGYAAVNANAATEMAFQDLIETVRARLRAERVHGFAGQFRVYPTQFRTIEARLLCGVLVHYCELTLLCDELVAVP